ncbi:TetR/AcrR family transcriptional regulator [Actinocorallia aurea]
MPEETSSTRDRLLAAAERLFLSKEPERVSVRAINAEAGLNPGAVHYHFGSRENLVAALLERELVPVWADRLGPLAERSQSDAAADTPSVRDLVTALVEPFEDLVSTEKGRMLCHLLARATLQRRRMPISSPWFSSTPFEVMLGRARPDLSVRQISDRWRLAFTLLLEIYGSSLAAGPSEKPPTISGAAIIDFLTAGLDAPPSA